MSQENVEIVHRCFERFNDGDIDGFLRCCAPDLEFRDLPSLPGSGVFIGHDAMRGWWTQLYDAFEDLRFDAAEFIEAGDRVVVIVHATGRGRGSSAEVEMHLSNVWTLSGGKVLSIVTYDDRAEALEAAGLEE